MKFLNGELVQTSHECLFLQGSQAFNVGDKVDIHYKGPDRSRFNKIGDIMITKITLDPPELRYGHHIGAVDYAVREDQTIHPVGTPL